MTLYYGSAAHLMTILFASGTIYLLFSVLKGRTQQTRESVVFALAVVNLIQHLFKPFVWPHVNDYSFRMIETAYNVCAFLIIATPLAIVLPSDTLRGFVCAVGFFAGMLPILVPQWFIGQTLFQWEYFRSYFCHLLLLLTSALPILWGRVRIRAKTAPLMGFLFFAMLTAVFADNVFCILGGIADGASKNNLWEALLNLNPFGIMKPSDSLPFRDFIAGFSLGIHCGKLEYVPVLWYFIPLYTLVTAGFAFAGRLEDYILGKLSKRRRRNPFMQGQPARS